MTHYGVLSEQLRVLQANHPSQTVVQVGDAVFGGGNFTVIAGPCAVENEESILQIAHHVKAAGAVMLRGGAYKPRTSPYSFQGLQEEGLRLLVKAGKEVGLPVVCEILDTHSLDKYSDIDMLQVGTRNMFNYELLKELSRCRKPILLKRGMCATVDEWLMSAEYLLNGGNENVVLCERGIRTFETSTRNTLDLASLSLIKILSHLPVIADPSHATGDSTLIKPMSLAAIAAGADGLMIEVHNHPELAQSDGMQSLNTAGIDTFMEDVRSLHDYFRTKGLHE